MSASAKDPLASSVSAARPLGVSTRPRSARCQRLVTCLAGAGRSPQKACRPRRRAWPPATRMRERVARRETRASALRLLSIAAAFRQDRTVPARASLAGGGGDRPACAGTAWWPRDDRDMHWASRWGLRRCLAVTRTLRPVRGQGLGRGRGCGRGAVPRLRGLPQGLGCDGAVAGEQY